MAKINEYPIEAISLNNTDFFDIDKDVDLLGTYETNKIRWQTIKSQFSLMTQIQPSGNVSGVTKSTVLGPFLGTMTVPSNTLKVGDTFHLNMSGLVRAANNETIQIFIETTSGVTLADTGIVFLPTITNKPWELEVDFVVREIGPSGVAQIVTIGTFTFNKDSGDRFEGKHFFSINSTTFDTTVDNTLDVMAQWGSINPLNRINSQITYLNKKF